MTSSKRAASSGSNETDASKAMKLHQHEEQSADQHSDSEDELQDTLEPAHGPSLHRAGSAPALTSLTEPCWFPVPAPEERARRRGHFVRMTIDTGTGRLPTVELAIPASLPEGEVAFVGVTGQTYLSVQHRGANDASATVVKQLSYHWLLDHVPDAGDIFDILVREGTVSQEQVERVRADRLGDVSGSSKRPHTESFLQWGALAQAADTTSIPVTTIRQLTGKKYGLLLNVRGLPSHLGKYPSLGVHYTSLPDLHPCPLLLITAVPPFRLLTAAELSAKRVAIFIQDGALRLVFIDRKDTNEGSRATLAVIRQGAHQLVTSDELESDLRKVFKTAGEGEFHGVYEEEDEDERRSTTAVAKWVREQMRQQGFWRVDEGSVAALVAKGREARNDRETYKFGQAAKARHAAASVVGPGM